MKKRDLNNLDFLDLSTMITDNEEALQNLKFQKAMQQLEDPLQIKSLKKGTQIVVGTPGRTNDLIRRKKLIGTREKKSWRHYAMITGKTMAHMTALFLGLEAKTVLLLHTI